MLSDFTTEMYDLHTAFWTNPDSMSHPLRPSIDKPLGIFLDSDGVEWLHNQDNISLLPLCLNLCIQQHLKPTLLWLRIALELTQQHATTSPSSGYRLEQADAWDEFERFCDNQFMIRMNHVPYLPRDREAVGLSVDDWQTCAKMARTGEWAADKARNVIDLDDPQRLPDVRGNRVTINSTYRRNQHTGEQARKQYGMQFTEEQIDKLEVLFAQIHDSPQFNRHGLTLPRSPLDGSPFLWRTRDMHETSSWEFVFREMRGVVWTIDLVCDPDFDTDEILYSILVHAVVE